MATCPGVPYVFEDNRKILQGPKIVLPLYSAPDASQQVRPATNSCAHEHERDRPRPLLPREVDGATRVVRLAGMLSPDDLRDDVFYEEVLEDITEEVCKFGDLLKVMIPRPGDPGGVGKVFLKYAGLNSSIDCLTSLDATWFAKRCIVATYYPEDRFAAGDYGHDG